MGNAGWVSRHRALAFLAVTFTWSWMIWIPAVLAFVRAEDKTFTPMMIVLALVGAYGPSVAAVCVTAWTGGQAEFVALLRRLLQWRAGAVWYAFVLLLCPIALMMALAIAGGLGNAVTARISGALFSIPLVVVTALPFGPLAEELGWRGYLLPSLQGKFSPVTSSVLLGLAWAFWHLPLWWVPGAALPTWSPLSMATVGVWGAYVISVSVLFTWVYNNTRGSVFIAVVLHLMTNATGRIVLPIFAGPPDAFFANVDMIRTFIFIGLAIIVAVFFGAGPRREDVGTVPSAA